MPTNKPRRRPADGTFDLTGDSVTSGETVDASQSFKVWLLDVGPDEYGDAVLCQFGNKTVLIDGGTTTFYLARELLGQPLQLVTNSLPIANLFLNDDHVELILTGGLMYPRYGVLLGPTTEQMLSTVHTKTLFLSVAGVYNGALYNQNLLLVQSERRMMEQAQEVVLLADSSKFGQQALSRLGELSEVDVVVTDSGIGEEHRREIEGAGCRVVVAE